MAPTKFLIVLDSPIGSYFPGQVVTGKVILSLDKEITSQGLKLKFNGEAEVKWVESHGQGSKGYHSNLSYFHEKMNLSGDDKNSDITMPAGEEVYPFSFKLPPNLPSSYESLCGNVRYSVEAIVKRSWKFDYNTKIMFTVNALVDLNLQSVYAEPQEVSKEKSICCLCCKEGPISMRVEMPRTGYVPGEYVKFSVYSSNSSSRTVSAIVVNFIREIQFHAQKRTKWHTDEITSVRGPEVKAFMSETWQGEFQIPPVPPTDLGGCKLIEMTYYAKFKLDIPNSMDLKKKIPIFVGTIPYTNFLSELQRNMPQTLQNVDEDISLPPLAPSAPPIPVFSQYPSMPVPVYQEASIYGKDGGKDNTSENNAPLSDEVEDDSYHYTPKYATYNFGWNFNSMGTGPNGLNG